MERRYKHTLKIEFDVESSKGVMPTNAEIASALFQMRRRDDLKDQVEHLNCEEVPTFRKIVFDEPIVFGGHKVAYGITVKLPIYDYAPVKMELHYHNKGTEVDCFQVVKRRFYTESEANGYKHMRFKHENTMFKLTVKSDDVVGREKFAFEQK
jgi:hypothetical protein